MEKSIPKAIKKSAGIYQIKNLINGKAYIGMTTGFAARYSHHASSLSKGNHGNQILQQAFIKHGTYAFVFEVLEVVDRLPGEELGNFKKRLFDLEYLYIVNAQSAVRSKGYNLEQDPRQPHNNSGADLVQEYSRLADGIPTEKVKYHESAYSKVFTAELVKEMRIQLARGIPVAVVANYFRATKSVVGKIRAGLIWKHTFPSASEIEEYVLPDILLSPSHVISSDRVKEIKFLLHEGACANGINQFFNQTRTGAISRGATYAEIVLTQADVQRFRGTDLYRRFELFNRTRLTTSRAASTAGAKRTQSKLKPSEIEQIASLLRGGFSCPEIVRQLSLSVDKSQVERIRAGKIWSEVSGIKPGDFKKGIAANLTGESNLSAKLNRAQVGEIKRLLADGQQKATIARRFNVDFSTIRAIQLGRTWRDA